MKYSCPKHNILMGNIMKIILLLFMACQFVLCLFSPVWSEVGDIGLKFEGETLSAELEEIPLKVVLENLEREKGIWFKCNKRLLEAKVSVQFKDLSLEDGLKRIIFRMNHSLIFDRNGKVEGVILIGMAGSDVPTRGVTASPVRGGSIPSMTPNKHINNTGALNVVENTLGGAVEITSDELENFKVIKNAPPPGGEIEITTKELQNFKVIRNCPPPGAPVEVTAEEVEEFKVIKNCSPLGGPVEASAEERLH